MQHLDHDRLVLLALSEEHEELTESDHLAHCAACRHEMEALRHVAFVGSQVQDLRELPPPPDHLWQAIAADIERPAPPAPVVDLATRRDQPSAGRKPSAGRTAPGRSRRRWLAPLVAAAAAAVLAVAGTVTVDRLTGPATAEQVTAVATLTPLATVPASAGGDVRVTSDGHLHIDVRDLPLTTGFHEVWLLDPDDPTRMVAVGNLPEAREAVLPVPAGTDLNRFRLVDVSDEPHDGDATHSGKSLLRGTLTN
ncbi:anti-sigma factor [Actinoplanes sp. DH11]|uniref:anti-sigma factor n=1 Tax=Actinoplanes sp. DH11 TaxID=2857011 RepID=UPI001E2B0B36|nr:anti-sigma factor [Actinoplanes sp. DH11]